MLMKKKIRRCKNCLEKVIKKKNEYAHALIYFKRTAEWSDIRMTFDHDAEDAFMWEDDETQEEKLCHIVYDCAWFVMNEEQTYISML